MVFKQSFFIITSLLALLGLNFAINGLPKWPDMVTRIDHPEFKNVYVIYDPEAWDFHVALAYHRGEADNPYTDGLAHYVEHLAWLNVFEGSGAEASRHSNAWTSATTTLYWQQVDYPDLVEAVQRLVRTAEPLTLSADFMREEIGIIQREYDQTVRGNAFNTTVTRELIDLAGDTPLATNVIGSKWSISKFTPEDAAKLHAETHNLKNASLIIWGDITADQLLAAQDEVVFPAPRTIKQEAQIPNDIETPNRSASVRHNSDIGSGSVHWNKLMKFDACRSWADCQARVEMIVRLLRSTRDGGLVAPLQYDDLLARKIGVFMWRYWQDLYVLNIQARTEDGVASSELQDKIEEVLAEIAEKGVSADVFDPLHKDAVADFDLDRLFPQDEYNNVIQSVAARGEYFSDIEFAMAIKALTLDDINAFLKGVGGDGRVVIRRYNP